MSQPRLKV